MLIVDTHALQLTCIEFVDMVNKNQRVRSDTRSLKADLAYARVEPLVCAMGLPARAPPTRRGGLLSTDHSAVLEFTRGVL